jgi:hypothetical protein
VTQRFYYWLVARENGRPYLVFGGNTEGEARQHGLEVLGNIDFEIKRYPTRDLGRASSMYKGYRLDKTHSLKDASRRIGHDKSVKRLRNKRPQGDMIW